MSQNGTIERVETDKGYGFIMGADRTRYFFHRTSLVAGQMLGDLYQRRPGCLHGNAGGEGAACRAGGAGVEDAVALPPLAV